MLNRPAYALLAATSLAPIALIWGVILLEAGRSFEATVALGAAVSGTCLCGLILRLLRRDARTETIEVVGSKSADDGVMAFAVTYLLPLLSPEEVSWTMIALLAILFVTIYQTRMVHVNPLLSLVFRYHFVEVQAVSGATYLLITKQRRPPEGVLNTHRIAPYVFLQVQT